MKVNGLRMTSLFYEMENNPAMFETTNQIGYNGGFIFFILVNGMDHYCHSNCPYPLVNIQKTMENHIFLMGKLTISGDFP